MIDTKLMDVLLEANITAIRRAKAENPKLSKMKATDPYVVGLIDGMSKLSSHLLLENKIRVK